MKNVQKIISLLLTVTLIMEMVPVAAVASETEAALDPGQVTVEGTNALGDLLMEEVNARQDKALMAQEEYESGFSVTELTFQGATATVTYDASDEATLVVAVYTEDGLMMLNSAYTQVDPEQTQASVTLRGEMPQYFAASAYLINTYDLSPLCPAYDTPVYTQSMQELLDSTVEDYPEDRVLNLDDDNTTNFVVCADAAIVVEEQEGINTLISADDETMTYVIGNADAQFTSLQSGDVVVYPYGDDQYVIAKVEKISVSGTTVTISGGELELEDVFSHVKIEEVGNSNDAEYDSSYADECVSYTNSNMSARSANHTPEEDETKLLTHDLEINYPKVGPLSLQLGIKMALRVNWNFYVTGTMRHMDLRIVSDCTFRGGIAAEIEGNVDLGLGLLKIPLGIARLNLMPRFFVSASGAVRVDSTVSIGFQCTADYKDEKWDVNANLITEDSPNLAVMGDLRFGIALGPVLEVPALLELKVEYEEHFEYHSELSLLEEEETDVKHICKECFDGDKRMGYSFGASISLLNGVVKYTRKVLDHSYKCGDYYVCLEHGGGYEDGECPYMAYRITFQVKDSYGNPVPRAKVEVSGQETLEVTNQNGVCSYYLLPGEYSVQVVSGEISHRVSTEVEAPEVVTITLPEEDAVESTGPEGTEPEVTTPSLPGGILDSGNTPPVVNYGTPGAYGYFGEDNNLKWEYYPNGTLRLSGTGEITENVWRNESYTDPVTHIGRGISSITKYIVVEEGITGIGTSLNQMDWTEKITLPSTVTRIENEAFAGTEALKEINIPATVTYIGESAFRRCRNLTEITIPGSVEEIGRYAFAWTGLNRVTVEEGIKNISNGMFESCPYLASVKLPSTVEIIEDWAFSGCSRLDRITIPDGVKEIGMNAFSMTALESVVIPKGVERLTTTFYNCPNLSNVVLNEGLITLNGSFNGCTSLTKIAIPSTVSNISTGAFQNCTNLREVDFARFALDKSDTSGTNIFFDAFKNCVSLKKINLPDITTLCRDAFAGCNALETVIMAGEIYEYLGEGYGYIYEDSTTEAFPNLTATVYYPYEYSEDAWSWESENMPAFYYSKDRMAAIGSQVTWIPYTVDEEGNMIPDESKAYCANPPEEILPENTGDRDEAEVVPQETACEESIPEESSLGETESVETEAQVVSKAAQTGPEENGSYVTVKLPAAAAANLFRLSAPGTAVRAMSDKEEISLGQITAPALDAIYGGDYSSEVTEIQTVKIADFSGLVPGEEYLLLALTSLETTDPLSIDNLIHIDQGTASDEGELSFRYVERQDFSVSYVMVSGVSNKDLKDAKITFPKVYASEDEQIIQPTVEYDGKTLTEGKDYVLSGKVVFSAAGTYTCYIRGIYNYSGTVVCNYTVKEDPNVPDPPVELPNLESFDLPQDYLLLNVDEKVSLTADVQPAELAAAIKWTIENGGEKVVSVEDGTVTALREGTAYVIASITDGVLTLTERCRIDVAAPVEIEGVQLSTHKLTTELFSTDYAEFEILLQLPQNMASVAAAGSRDLERKDLRGVAIESAVFSNEAMEGLFELKVLDDRRVAVVPTENAVEWTFYYPEDKDVAGSYVTAVEVSVDGKTYTSENMTLTVKRSKPKLKVTVPTFNSFYSWQEQKISVIGGTVTKIDGIVPDWLYMFDDTLQLESDIPLKNLSGKAVLEIYTEEWRVPATVSVTVKSVYKPPELKLSATTVTMGQDADSSEGIQLQLLPKAKGVTLADLKVEDVMVVEDYLTPDFNPEDGTFTIIPIHDFPSGKITLNVYFEDTINTVSLPLTVKTVAVTLKLSKPATTLNSGNGDSAAIGVTVSPADYRLTAPVIRLIGADKSDRLNSGELKLSYENGRLSISTTDLTPDNAKYTLYISAEGGKEAALKISTTNAEPTLKLKANGNLDLSFPDRKIGLTTTFKNHSGGNLKAIDYTVTESSGKTILDEDSKAIQLIKDGADLFVQLKETAGINIKNTYTLNLKLTLENGKELESSVKIPVKQTNISLKLSANKLTLNKAIDDKATVTVTCATKDYNFTDPVWTLLDSKGNDASGQLDISWNNGKLTVATTEATPYGGSYKLLIAPEKGAKAVTLAIVIPAEAKSTVTGTLKATGNLDVIRDGTALTITPTWKNCNEAERTEILTIRNGSGEDVTAQFVIEEENGKYVLTRAGALDHTQKYTATLTATFTNGTTATATGALKLKMGSAKLTLKADSTTLFANDKHSRVNISFASADSTLNKVAGVELDPKLANQFEIIDYKNGQYAIGFRDGAVPAKLTSVNLALNVWLEGNETAKANVSVKVKLNIVR